MNQLIDKLRHFLRSFLIGELAGTHRHMTAAAVFQHKAADVHAAGAVKYRISHRAGAALAALAVNYPAGDILLGIQRIYKEAISGVYGRNTAQVCDYQVALNAGMLVNHVLEFLGLFAVKLYTLLYIGHFENFICGHVSAAFQQLLHKLIVAYRKVSKAPQTRSRIHKKSDQNPARRIKHLIAGKISAVHFIDSLHKVVEIRKALLTSVIFVNNSRAAGSDTALALILTLILPALLLAGVVVEPQPAALNKGYVRKAVILGNGNESVLQILRMSKGP